MLIHPMVPLGMGAPDLPRLEGPHPKAGTQESEFYFSNVFSISAPHVPTHLFTLLQNNGLGSSLAGFGSSHMTLSGSQHPMEMVCSNASHKRDGAGNHVAAGCRGW